MSDTPTDICSRCYHEEQHSGSSRRHRSNQKSVIFTKTAFQNSFEQSPSRKHFTKDGITDTLPIDLHIDLGNYCNLACKMCWSGASSRIATQYVKWGHEEHKPFLGNDWTKDLATWTRFLNELLTIPKLKNVHFMGGETILTPRFEEFVDFMTANKRFDLSISFVTNGTKFNESLVNKLKQFTRVGIEVSIETTTAHNDYVRQGTDTKIVLDNIKLYQQHCNNTSISLTIRPAVSALTVGYYYTLLEYCLDQKLIIKSLLVTNPPYLNINILPKDIKENYSKHYLKLLDRLESIDINIDYNESDPNNYAQSIKTQIYQILSILDEPVVTNNELLKELVTICKKWDQEFNYNAKSLYPELKDILSYYDY